MRKLCKSIVSLGLVAAAVWCGMRIADKDMLEEKIIRLHVVANSDSKADQQIKLSVRDAVLEVLSGIQADNTQQAREYLYSLLPVLQDAANRALAENGSKDLAVVTLRREAFPTRQYDTFSLPAGVYESLRVTIGSGEGQNWWCVVFPNLCFGAASEDVRDTAAGAGFSDDLGNTITGNKGYSLNFFFLDCWGRLQNLFYLG